MALECPRTAYIPAGGGRPVFHYSPGLAVSEVVQLPCGKCALCRQRDGLDWRTRITNEASLYREDCFVTLTYAPEHMPPDLGLHVEHMRKFFMDLRNWIRRHYDERKIRYYYVGEYSPAKRPHYHICLFNFRFPDETHWRGKGDMAESKSSIAEAIWGRGMVHIGMLTASSAAYVAGYVLKKQNARQADYLYLRTDPQTGRSWYVPREFAHMSTGGGGIGAAFFDKWRTDIFPHDLCIVDGREQRVPRFYDRRFEKQNPEVFEQIAARRKAESEARAADNTPERRAVKEQVAIARQALKQRNKV